MKEKEFNLSEKESIEGDCKYDREDVKEFIKRLKKEVWINCVKGSQFNQKYFEDFIDKLAGDKLK